MLERKKEVCVTNCAERLQRCVILHKQHSAANARLTELLEKSDTLWQELICCISAGDAEDLLQASKVDRRHHSLKICSECNGLKALTAEGRCAVGVADQCASEFYACVDELKLYLSDLKSKVAEAQKGNEHLAAMFCKRESTLDLLSAAAGSHSARAHQHGD